MPFLQVGLRSLNVISYELIACYNYSNFNLKIKNWFYSDL